MPSPLDRHIASLVDAHRLSAVVNAIAHYCRVRAASRSDRTGSRHWNQAGEILEKAAKSLAEIR